MSRGTNKDLCPGLWEFIGKKFDFLQEEIINTTPRVGNDLRVYFHTHVHARSYDIPPVRSRVIFMKDRLNFWIFECIEFRL